MSIENRRPIQARSLGPMKSLASAMARSQITPNQISVASVVVASLTPLSLHVLGNETWPGCLLAVLGIQLRLVCNLIDGMVAVEGGKRSVLGDIYNEFPDRLADTVILLGFAYAAGQPALGWAASFFAVLTAYTRNLGAALKTKHYYVGPMAKQHRMALVTVALLVSPLAPRAGISASALAEIVLWIISVGAAVTTARRLGLIAAELKSR